MCAVFQACQDLTTLHLHGSPLHHESLAPEPYIQPTIVASSVRTLKLHIPEEGDFSYYFFKPFALPSLETLHLHAAFTQARAFARDLSDTAASFTPKFPMLTTLALSSVELEVLRMILRKLLTVTHLRVVNLYVDDLLEDLEMQEADGQSITCKVLPILDTITWTGSSEEAVIQLRQLSQKCPLTKVNIWTNFLKLPSDLQHELSELVDVHVLSSRELYDYDESD
ncbi:hypothetical protein OE88DRAFT_717069 [Heliocybe sulcata]|uniref:F-box domain-containing protein n=1 Tax=Heliocybe sulcata TaxID=5364 RepID=A0A5C3NH49_9AGAM|nr:hypothetical protein OE88DRAFT_717069 [Heliocybe sulcata]